MSDWKIDAIIKNMKDINCLLLEYLDNDDSSQDELFNLFKQKGISKNANKFYMFFDLFTQVTLHHHRYSSFPTKVDNIISYFEKELKIYFDDTELFELFNENMFVQRLLLEKKIISMNQDIYKKICDATQKAYFFKFINKFIDDKEMEGIKKKLPKKEISDLINNHRKIAQIIRTDSVKQFKNYFDNDFDPSDEIESSLFETNPLLFDEVSYIEYAAFYGSINIFEYLYDKKAQYDEKIWTYAACGNNIDLIKYMHKKKFEANDKIYEKCYFKAIQSHHNELANYIKETFLNDKKITIRKQCFQYRNYAFLKKALDEKDMYSLFEFYYPSISNYFILIRHFFIMQFQMILMNFLSIY